MKGFIIGITLFVLLSTLAFAEFDYSETNISTTFDDGLFFVGDNINVSIKITNVMTGDPIPSTPDFNSAIHKETGTRLICHLNQLAS